MILKERWAKLAGIPLNEQDGEAVAADDTDKGGWKEGMPPNQDLVNLIVKFINTLQSEDGGTGKENRSAFIQSVKLGGPIGTVIKTVVDAGVAAAGAIKDKTSESSSIEPITEIGERLNWLKIISGGKLATLKRLGKEIAKLTSTKGEFKKSLEAAASKVNPPLSDDEQTHILDLVDKYA